MEHGIQASKQAYCNSKVNVSLKESFRDNSPPLLDFLTSKSVLLINIMTTFTSSEQILIVILRTIP